MNNNISVASDDQSIEERYNEITEYFGDEITEDLDRFENFRKNIVTTIAYLIGVSEEHFIPDGPFNNEDYEKIKDIESAKIIRCLSVLRTQFIKNFQRILIARNDLRPLESLTELLDVDAIKYLRSYEMEINVPNAKTPLVNIAYINQYILDNVDKIKSLIPDWVKFQYIKNLFLIPGGYSGHNGSNLKGNPQKIFSSITNATKPFGAKRNAYPYHMYLTWPQQIKEDCGNIIYNDLKFLKLLYSAFGDRFQASRYVVDAKTGTKEGVYKFLEDAANVAIFVDCENVDPYAFGATILNLDREIMSKIKKIILYDDIHTATAWNYITNIIDIPVDKRDTKRLIDNKSLVDPSLITGVCEEYWKNNTESIILASSDSDFWPLIVSIPQARFLVLNEYSKTSAAIIDVMDKNNVQHCYMSDFAQDIIQKFKSDVLFLGLSERIKNFNKTGVMGTLDVDTLLRDLFFDAGIGGADGQLEREKKAFFEKYLKNGLVLKPVNENGKIVLKIEISKR